EVHRRVRGRRGTRLLALTSGGAIPEAADYRVVLEPDDTFIGTLNEDFAIESMAGDVFQLGNASWRVIQVTAGTVRVADAQGAPPNIPFWLGEAPARSDELSRAVSDLRAEAGRILEREPEAAKEADSPGVPGPRALAEWLERETGLTGAAAGQLAAYLEQGRRALGAIPTQDTLVAERFFDESGGMQLVLHAPFGSRINRAWALALRKRFCRQFNFELQAAATEDAILLSLGPQHSFPLADVFRYLHPASVRDVLVQALLDAPLFRTRWRWNAAISLAVPRNRGGRKVPPQLQRMQADDLLAAVFPDAAACLENLPADRVVPDHPLVNQTIRDCLHEAMDLDGLECLLERIHTGQVRCLSRDTPEPSPFADEVLNARPYTFLDDAPLEERRAQAVQARAPSARGGEPMRALDASAIARVRGEERPDPRDADQLHDALLTAGFLLEHECDPALLRELAKARRAARVVMGPLPDRALPGDAGETAAAAIWVAAERLPEMTAVHPGAEFEPPIAAPPSRAARVWPREAALAELLRDRLGIEGPVTAARLAAVLSVTPPDVEAALTDLESEGVVLRGRFTPGEQALEWCDRRLLARIHRYTLDRLRSEIAPVPAADFMRFLLAWHHVAPGTQLTGIDGVRAVVAQLDGLQLPARAWERDVLPARVDSYDPSMLDLLCLTGEVGWARLSSGPAQMAGATPVALFLREHADAWFAVHADDRAPAAALSDAAAQVLAHLCAHGASFAADIGAACELAGGALRGAIGELASAGLVASDGVAGLRELVRPGSDERPTRPRRTDAAGRWWALRTESRDLSRDEAVEMAAWALLRRYGVVLRRLMLNESMPVPWRDLVRVYRRLEARGEIRGGRFVSGLSGEQFALPEAVERLREIRRLPPDNRLIVLSAADPLNLTGIVTHDDRIRAVAGNRILYRNGIVVAAMEGGVLRSFGQLDPPVAAAAAAALAGRRVPVVSGFVGTRR
ncbi:MAG TPA: hypothetical protein VNI78_12575, partial [Vicinamibacterales bacterium]|nr:hypothetical protein [Vicinamibacterales bacterium]